jgi:hypothetical protein
VYVLSFVAIDAAWGWLEFCNHRDDHAVVGVLLVGEVLSVGFFVWMYRTGNSPI